MSVSTDLIIVIAVFGFFASLGFVLGKRTLISLIVSFYFGFLLYFNFPYLQNVLSSLESPSGDFYGIIGVFLLFSLATLFAIRPFISSEFRGGLMKFIELGVLSLFAGGLLMMLLINIAAVSKIYQFSNTITQFFTFTNSLFWWLLAGIPILGVIGRR